MSRAELDVLGAAVDEMLGAAALVDMLQSNLDRNAFAARGMFRGYDKYRIHLLTEIEARALDHVMNAVVCAAGSLRAAHDAIS